MNPYKWHLLKQKHLTQGRGPKTPVRLSWDELRRVFALEAGHAILGGHPGSTRPAVDLLRFLRLLLIEISLVVFSVALKFWIRVPKSAAHFTSRLSFDPVASIHAQGYAQGVPLPSLADASPFGAQLPPAAVPPVACLEAPELSKALRPGGCRGKVWGRGGVGGVRWGGWGVLFFPFFGVWSLRNLRILRKNCSFKSAHDISFSYSLYDHHAPEMPLSEKKGR